MANYIGGGKPDVEKALLVAFDTPPYFDFYSTIAMKYKSFEFSDKLTDTERMSEYAKIYQQFRKFVGSKKAMVMDRRDSLESLRAWFEDQLAKSDVYPSNRIDMVYNSLKVDWLRQAIGTIDMLMEEINGGY